MHSMELGARYGQFQANHLYSSKAERGEGVAEAARGRSSQIHVSQVGQTGRQRRQESGQKLMSSVDNANVAGTGSATLPTGVPTVGCVIAASGHGCAVRPRRGNDCEGRPTLVVRLQYCRQARPVYTSLISLQLHAKKKSSTLAPRRVQYF